MERKFVPQTDLNVSRMCLGTMMFGGQTAKEDAIKIVHAALDGGINFLDTANIYTKGSCETILGEALEGRRDKVILATKVGGPAWEGPDGRGNGQKHVLASVEKSLERLRTDYIDIFYYHFPDHKTPFEEMIETMNILIKQGKIRYWGVSNFAAWELCSLVEKAKAAGLKAPVITQSVYNMLTRGADEELIPFIKEYNIGLAPYNPLAAGLLTGKHSREKAVENTRFALEKGYRMRYWKDQNFDAVDMLADVAREAGISLLELAVRWLMSEPAITAPIIGVSRMEQLLQNGSLVEKGPLPEDLREKCNCAWDMIKGDYFNYHR